MTLGISSALAGDVGDKAKPAKVQWAANQVHALYNPDKKQAAVDVNDKFTIKSFQEGEGYRVRVGVLDGARAMLGTCEAAAKLKAGDRRTTWLDVQYKPDAAGNTAFTIRRTLDFNKHDRVYKFTAGEGARATLEPGVEVSLNNGVLVYEQSTGPIGTSGDTKALRLSYKLNDNFADISASVEMDQQAWAIATNRPSAGGAPLYSVNNNAVLPHVEGTKGIVQAQTVVANPVRGPGIGAAANPALLKVSGRPSTSIQGLQVSDDAEQALCLALPCSFDFQCKSSGQPSSCICHDLDGPGPNLGVCQV